MAFDTSKLGPPPRNTATALPGQPGRGSALFPPGPLYPRPTAGPIVFPQPKPGSHPFQNGPVGGLHYTGQPHPPQFGPAPAPRPAPAPGGAGTGTATPAPGPPYLDSTYYQNVATHDFNVNNQIAGLQQRQAYSQDDLQRALIQLAHSQALTERADRERANSSGLLSSTTLANTLGELTRSGGDRQAALQTQNSRQNAAILAQIAGLRGGQQLFDQGQSLAAAQRQAAADAANRALGETPPGGSGGGSGGSPAAAAVNTANASAAHSGALNPGGQIYQPHTDAQGHLLPPVPGQPPLVRPARLPPPRRRPGTDDKGPVRRAY